MGRNGKRGGVRGREEQEGGGRPGRERGERGGRRGEFCFSGVCPRGLPVFALSPSARWQASLASRPTTTPSPSPAFPLPAPRAPERGGSALLARRRAIGPHGEAVIERLCVCESPRTSVVRDPARGPRVRPLARQTAEGEALAALEAPLVHFPPSPTTPLPCAPLAARSSTEDRFPLVGGVCLQPRCHRRTGAWRFAGRASSGKARTRCPRAPRALVSHSASSSFDQLRPSSPPPPPWHPDRPPTLASSLVPRGLPSSAPLPPSSPMFRPAPRRVRHSSSAGHDADHLRSRLLVADSRWFPP